MQLSYSDSMSPLCRVTLDSFEGEIAFLVHLVQKQELDIYQIPLLDILKGAHQADRSDLDEGAEFIDAAGMLMLLKSRCLLPKHEQVVGEGWTAEEEPLPPLTALLDYCRFREAGKQLSQREEEQSDFFLRGAASPEMAKPFGIAHLSLDDLSSIFQNILKKAASGHGLIQEEEWRVSDKMRLIQEMLQENKRFPLEFLFDPNKHRLELIVTFLATLELMKAGKIWITKRDEGIFVEQPGE